MSVRRRAMLWFALAGAWWAATAAAVTAALPRAEGSLTIPSDPLSLLSTLGFPTVAVILLVREIVVPKGRLDDQKALTAEALAGWKAQTDATNRIATAVEERNKLDRLDREAER